MKKWQMIVLSVAMTFVLTSCGLNDQDFQAKDPNATEAVIVEIKSGSTTKSIAAQLEEAGLINKAEAFIAKVKELDAASALKAGKYSFSASMSVEEMVNAIAKGAVFTDRVKVVIPEGYEVRQIVDKLVDAGLIDPTIFENELQNGTFDYNFLKGIDRSYKLEGFLFPATYQFAKDATEHQIIDQMLKTFEKHYSTEDMAKATALGMDTNELITLASIIERETKRPEELATVSSVFHNRLKLPMRLQSCATVQYILGERKEVLSIKDTQIKSPYNTYMNDGLPPAPIASPGRAAIEAALNPASTEYLYFVTTNNGDGSHYFAKTLDEHNANIKKSKK